MKNNSQSHSQPTQARKNKVCSFRTKTALAYSAVALTVAILSLDAHFPEVREGLAEQITGKKGKVSMVGTDNESRWSHFGLISYDNEDVVSAVQIPLLLIVIALVGLLVYCRTVISDDEEVEAKPWTSGPICEQITVKEFNS